MTDLDGMIEAGLATSVGPAGLEVRLIRPSDLQAVYAIESSSFDRPYPRSLIDQLAKTNPSTFIVASLGGVIVGYAVGAVKSQAGHIISIAVHPNYRRRHVGTILLSNLLRLMSEERAKTAHLEVSVKNLGAIAFYEHLGFRKVGRIPDYYGYGEDAYVYSLELP